QRIRTPLTPSMNTPFGSRSPLASSLRTRLSERSSAFGIGSDGSGCSDSSLIREPLDRPHDRFFDLRLGERGFTAFREISLDVLNHRQPLIPDPENRFVVGFAHVPLPSLAAACDAACCAAISLSVSFCKCWVCTSTAPSCVVLKMSAAICPSVETCCA